MSHKEIAQIAIKDLEKELERLNRCHTTSDKVFSVQMSDINHALEYWKSEAQKII